MADDRYDWLDKDAAERMLRGEPVSARDDDGARELRQLLDAAAAVGGPAATSTELPGEAAALAAFRQARTGAGDRAHTRGAGGPAPTTVRTARRGGVAERTRLGRPFRHGFAVALAVCAIGGVAVAAGTGVLPTPFRHGTADPEPAATISAVESPGPLETQEPDPQTGTESGIPTSPGATPGQDPTGRGTTEAPDGHGSTKTPGGPGGTPGHESPSGAPDDGGSGSQHGDRKQFVLALCRDYESGKRGEMDRATRRRLERKAGGAEKVHAFCRGFLARYGSGDGSGSGSDGGGSGGAGNGGASGGSGGGTRPGTGPGGDEDDDSHPSSAPSTTPGPGASTPAPTPTTAPEAGDATPSATASGQV